MYLSTQITKAVPLPFFFLLYFLTTLQQVEAQVPLFSFMDEDYKFGYMNEVGDTIIPPQFDFASNFFVQKKTPASSSAGIHHNDKEVLASNTAVIMKNGLYGYIKQDGSLIAPKFEHAYPFHCGFAIVKYEDNWQLINEQGEKVKSLSVIMDVSALDYNHALITHIDSCNYLMSFRRGGYYGVINSKGDIIKEATFITPPNCNTYFSPEGVKMKYITLTDFKGAKRLTIAPSGRLIEPQLFKENMDTLIKKHFKKTGEKYEIASGNNQALINSDIVTIKSFIFRDGMERFAIVQIKNEEDKPLMGVIDLKKQKYAFEPQVTEIIAKPISRELIFYFQNDKMYGLLKIDENPRIIEGVESNTRWGIRGRVRGNIVITYDKQNQNFHLMDIKSEETLLTLPQSEYTQVNLDEADEKYIFLTIWKGQEKVFEYIIYDRKGNEILISKTAQPTSLNGYAPMRLRYADRDEEYFYVNVYDKYGIMNVTGEYIVPPFFDEVRYLGKGKPIIVSINKKYGLLDENAELIIEPIFALIRRTHTPDILRVGFGQRREYININGALLGFTKKDVFDEWKRVEYEELRRKKELKRRDYEEYLRNMDRY